MPGRLLQDGTRLPSRPFSVHKNRLFCVKNQCNTLFFSEDLLAIHERFCHSEHALGGESPATKERCNRRLRGDAEDVIMNAEVVVEEQSEEDRMYQTMLKMSSQFFDEFLGKARRGEIPAEDGKQKNLEEEISVC